MRGSRAAALVLGLLASSVASAQVTEQGTTQVMRAWDSKEALGNMFTFGFKLGSYRPDIGIAFTDTFNSNSMLVGELEFEKYFTRKYGSAGLAVGISYAEKWGNATTGGPPGSSTVTGTSAVRTSLQVIPLYLDAVYKADYFALRYGFPLIPYVRLGLVGIPFIASNSGTVEVVGNQSGSGFRLGWNVTGGLSFMLDVLDPTLARDIDIDIGVKHTYFFAEFNNDSMFDPNAINLGSQTFLFGIGMDFERGALRLTVLYFGAARERVGRSRGSLELSRADATVRDVLDALVLNQPALAALVPHLRVAVNQEFVPLETSVPDGAEVALIPPVAGGAPRCRVLDAPLELSAVVARVSDLSRGGLVTFSGQVREQSHGKRVVKLEYEAYEEMAVKVFEQICQEAAATWPGVEVAIDHRVGTLVPGELAVVIAAASPHRKEAFLACSHAIERLKTDAPIWKKEHFDDGAVWVGLGP